VRISFVPLPQSQRSCGRGAKSTSSRQVLASILALNARACAARRLSRSSPAYRFIPVLPVRFAPRAPCLAGRRSGARGDELDGGRQRAVPVKLGTLFVLDYALVDFAHGSECRRSALRRARRPRRRSTGRAARAIPPCLAAVTGRAYAPPPRRLLLRSSTTTPSAVRREALARGLVPHCVRRRSSAGRARLLKTRRLRARGRRLNPGCADRRVLAHRTYADPHTFTLDLRYTR